MVFELVALPFLVSEARAVCYQGSSASLLIAPVSERGSVVRPRFWVLDMAVELEGEQVFSWLIGWAGLKSGLVVEWKQVTSS